MPCHSTFSFIKNMAWFKTYHAIQSCLTINDKWYLILLKILATEADHLKKRDKTDLKMTYCPLCMLLSSKFEISFSVTNLQTEADPLSPFLKDKKSSWQNILNRCCLKRKAPLQHHHKTNLAKKSYYKLLLLWMLYHVNEKWQVPSTRKTAEPVSCYQFSLANSFLMSGHLLSC